MVNALRDSCLHLSRPRTSLIYCPRHSFTVTTWGNSAAAPATTGSNGKSPAPSSRHMASGVVSRSTLNLRRKDSMSSLGIFRDCSCLHTSSVQYEPLSPWSLSQSCPCSVTCLASWHYPPPPTPTVTWRQEPCLCFLRLHPAPLVSPPLGPFPWCLRHKTCYKYPRTSMDLLSFRGGVKQETYPFYRENGFWGCVWPPSLKPFCLSAPPPKETPGPAKGPDC